MPSELVHLCAVDLNNKRMPLLPTANSLSASLLLTKLMCSESAKSMRLVCRPWRQSIDNSIQRLLIGNNDPKQPATTKQSSARNGRQVNRSLQLDVRRLSGLRSLDIHKTHQITLTSPPGSSSSSSSSPQSLKLPNIGVLAIDLARPHALVLPQACPNTLRLSATCNGFAPQGAVARHIGMGMVGPAGIGIGGGGLMGLGEHAGLAGPGGGAGAGGGAAEIGGGGLVVHFAGDARTPSPSLGQVSIQRSCSKALIKACASLPLLRELGIVALDISRCSLWEEMSSHCPRIDEMRLFGCTTPGALSSQAPSPQHGPSSPSSAPPPLSSSHASGGGAVVPGAFRPAFSNLKKLTMRSCHPVVGASKTRAMVLAVQLAALPPPNPPNPPNPPPPLVAPLLPPLAEAFAALHAAMHGLPPAAIEGLQDLPVLAAAGGVPAVAPGGGGGGGGLNAPLTPDAALWKSFFRSLPTHAPNLEKLDLSQNGLEFLPTDGFGSLPSLETLDLSANRIIDIPLSLISGLVGLKSLDLSHNHVEVVPESLAALTALTHLNLSRNWRVSDEHLGSVNPPPLPQILLFESSLPSSPLLLLLRLNAWSLVRLSSLKGIKTLDISYVFSMNSFPLELCFLTDLSSLSLKCTYVHTFPTQFSLLASLTHLDLSFNSQIEQGMVSAVLRPPCRTQLVSLSINHLDLTLFPVEILSLTQLTSLECARNRFSSIPPGFSSLAKLQSLNLQGAYAHRTGSDLALNLATSIYKLANLRNLNLGCNFTGNLPPGISAMTKLESLSLCMNSLIRLPAGIER